MRQYLLFLFAGPPCPVDNLLLEITIAILEELYESIQSIDFSCLIIHLVP